MVNIVGIRGVTVSDENGANPDVVTLLEELITDAKSGALKAIALSAIYGNHNICTRSAASTGYRHSLLAGTVYLQIDLAAESKEIQ